MDKEAVIESSGNASADLGFSPAEPMIFAMRAESRAHIRENIAAKHGTQTEAAAQLGIGQSRVSDLMRGKGE